MSFACPYDECYEKKLTFTNREDLCQHIDTHYYDSVFICPYDGCYEKKLMFSNEKDLYRHIDTNHYHNFKQVQKCDICDYNTSNMNDLKRHKRYEHTCKWCKYRVPDGSYRLSDHICP